MIKKENSLISSYHRFNVVKFNVIKVTDLHNNLS